MDQNIIIPALGMLTGIIVPVSVFIWLYYEEKGKRDTILEISKHLDDPSKLQELMTLFDERKKTTYRLPQKWCNHNICRLRTLHDGDFLFR